jgi:hypothetical protein
VAWGIATRKAPAQGATLLIRAALRPMLQKSKMKSGSGTVIPSGPQPPGVVLDNGAADRKTHPEAAWLGRMERDEELLHAPGIKPREARRALPLPVEQ